MNPAVPRQDQRKGTVELNLGLGFTKVKGVKGEDGRGRGRTQIVWVVAQWARGIFSASCHP